MSTKPSHTGIDKQHDITINESIAAMMTSQDYINRLVEDILKNEVPGESIVTTALTTQEQINELVDELLKIA